MPFSPGNTGCSDPVAPHMLIITLLHSIPRRVVTRQEELESRGPLTAVKLISDTVETPVLTGTGSHLIAWRGFLSGPMYVQLPARQALCGTPARVGPCSREQAVTVDAVRINKLRRKGNVQEDIRN